MSKNLHDKRPLLNTNVFVEYGISDAVLSKMYLSKIMLYELTAASISDSTLGHSSWTFGLNKNLMKLLYKIALMFILLFSANAVFAQTNEREKAIEFYNQGEYQNAADILQKTIEANANDRTALLYLGMSLARAKKPADAVEVFKKADKLKKNNDNTPNQMPLKITLNHFVPYTDLARANSVQGTVKLAIEFGADDQIKSIFPFQTLPGGLTADCIKAVQKIRFYPASKDGKLISIIEIISYSFSM